MTPVVALLRGVNVGGHGKISMEGLRAICVSLKLDNPQTHIQSGKISMQAPPETSGPVQCSGSDATNV